MPKLKFEEDINEVDTTVSSTKDEETYELGTIVKIPINKIKIGENIRNVMEDDENELQRLAESIKEQGQIEPCIVYQEGNEYILKAGSRRYKASMLAEMQTLDCIIDKKFENEIERIIYQATENEHRSNMSSRERENYMARLSDMGYSNVEIAKMLHKSTGWVSQALTVHETLKNNSFISELEREPTTRDTWEFSRLSDELKKKVENKVTEKKEKNEPVSLKEEVKKVKEEKKAEEQKKENDEINRSFNIEQSSSDNGFDINFEIDDNDSTNDTEIEETASEEKTIGIHINFVIDETTKSFKLKSDKDDFDSDIEKYTIRMIENYYMDKGYKID